MIVAACCISLLASTAYAQVRAQPAVVGTRVQLPIVNVISVQTTVAVPDRGGAYLGGVSSHRESRNQNLLGVGPIFRSTDANGISARAVIHDFEAHERALGLRQATPPAEFQSTKPAARPRDQAADYLARARQAERSGKPGVARIYYRMAQRRMEQARNPSPASRP
jgi:hypothetical protein